MGDLVYFLQNNTISRAELSFDDGEIFDIHYGDILIKFNECLDASIHILPAIKNVKYRYKFTESFLKAGDVVMADTAEDETVGKCLELCNIEDKNIVSGLHTIPMRPYSKFASGYLGFYMNTNIYHDQLLPLMQGSKVTSISRATILETYIKFPADIKEQKYIADYFLRIDHLITLHQRKYEKLLKIKKSMLENMFPKNGEMKPKIRFKGFTDDWEQRKLGEICNLLTGYPFESKNFSSDGIKLVRGMNVKRGYLDFTGENCKRWKSSIGLENYILQEGDILIQMDGALIGQSYAKIDGNQLPALLVQRVTRARADLELCDSDFVYSLIQKGFLQYVKESKTETAIPHLSLNDIGCFVISTPTLMEQQKIGTYFRNLDHLITLHQRKLEKLKKLKKSMLENMFA